MKRPSSNPPHPASPGRRESIPRRVRLLAARVRRARLRGWLADGYVPLGVVLLLVTTFTVLAYYVNHPRVELYPDSNGYIDVGLDIMRHGRYVSTLRLPGYPLLMALVFTLAGRQDFAALSAVQGGLFVLATLEVFAVAALAIRRAWVAFSIGLAVGTNIYLLKYVKPITADGFALWLVVTLALVTVLFVRVPRVRTLWLVAAVTLALFMTRPEWIYVPVPLFAALALVAARRGVLRRVLPHAIAAVVLLNGVLGLYVYANTVEHGYRGVTVVQNVNLLGKVLQYRMEDQAPSAYAQVMRVAHDYVAGGHVGPWRLLQIDPALATHNAALAGRYALAIIARHPIEFVARSVPVLFTSSSVGYLNDDFRTISAIQPSGAFGGLLLVLRAVSTTTYLLYILFPVIAFACLILFVRRHARRLRRGAHARPMAAHEARAASTEALEIVALLGLYALVITTLGGYGDYARIHSSFNPLELVAIGGSLYALACRWREARASSASPSPASAPPAAAGAPARSSARDA